jgi:hypothetical protein
MLAIDNGGKEGRKKELKTFWGTNPSLKRSIFTDFTTRHHYCPIRLQGKSKELSVLFESNTVCRCSWYEQLNQQFNNSTSPYLGNL